MRQAVSAAEARSRSLMLKVAEVMGFSETCVGGSRAASFGDVAMRLPTAPRAKPELNVLIPATDAFVPRRPLRRHHECAGPRSPARVTPGALPRVPELVPGSNALVPDSRSDAARRGAGGRTLWG